MRRGFSREQARENDSTGGRASCFQPASWTIPGRPDYPARPLGIIREQCGVREGVRGFEIGPGMASKRMRVLISPWNWPPHFS